MEQVDKSIRILAWIIAGTLFIFLSLISIYGHKFDAITEENPVYGLAIIMIPTLVICVSANILGRVARENGVHFSYIKTKLFMQPIIWLSLLASAVIAGVVNGS